MTAEQIKKLAAAGLTVEQIAVVAEVMEPASDVARDKPAPYYPPGCRGPEKKTWPTESSWGTENR